MKYLKNFNTLLEYEDALILDVPNVSYIVETEGIRYSEEPKIGSKYILYTSWDGKVVTPNKTNVFGASLLSNNYDDFGLLSFDDSVTTIGSAAFQYCTSLTSITIPNSVTSIGDRAFLNCTSLSSIIIPHSVESLGKNNAFYNCSALTSMIVEFGNTTYDSRDTCNAIIETATNTLIAGCQNTVIPNSVTSIGNYAFCGCSSLTSVTIPNSVTSIGKSAFLECTSLTFITCTATTPPTLDAGNSLSNVTVVYVPSESVEAYKTATNWSYYASKILPIQ